MGQYMESWRARCRTTTTEPGDDRDSKPRRHRVLLQSNEITITPFASALISASIGKLSIGSAIYLAEHIC